MEEVRGTIFPGVYYQELPIAATEGGMSYKYVWHGHDERFRVNFSGYVPRGYHHFDGETHSEGMYHTSAPGETKPDGWKFALEIFQGLKNVKGLTFSVSCPISSGGRFSVDLTLDDWLMLVIERMTGLKKASPYTSQVEVFEKDWNSETAQQIVKLVSAVWESFYDLYPTRTQASVVYAENCRDRGSNQTLWKRPASQLLSPSEQHEVCYDHTLFIYPDGSMLLLGNRAWIVGGELVEFQLQDESSVEKLIARLRGEFEAYDENHE